MKRNMRFEVCGWLNGSDYDAKKQPDYRVDIHAEDESQADELGDKMIEKKHGKCDVIVSHLVKR